MLARAYAGSVVGIHAHQVDVEVDIGFGLPAVILVGLAEASVKESRERVRAAVRHSGFDFPDRKITINLAPADERKEGSAFDLPIAVD